VVQTGVVIPSIQVGFFNEKNAIDFAVRIIVVIPSIQVGFFNNSAINLAIIGNIRS